MLQWAMKKLLISPGTRFSHLIALEDLGTAPPRHNQRMWRCQCDCGKISVVYQYHLLHGHTKSCGCMSRITHGLTNSPEYRAWGNMKERCYNPKHPGYKDYGGRGIKVCQRWLDSFTAFLKDMGERPGPDHSIDRIDNSGNYTPKNCRWATRAEQLNNTRRNCMFTHNGETRTLAQWVAQWSDETNIPTGILRNRILQGWSVEDALTKPVRPYNDDGVTFNGETHTLVEWGDITGINPTTIRTRLRQGWSVENALTLPLSRGKRIKKED